MKNWNILVWMLILPVAYIAGQRSADRNAPTEAMSLYSLITNTTTLRSVGGYGTSGTSLLPQLRAIKGLPSSLDDDGTNVTNTWGGAVTVVSTGPGFFVE